MLRITMTQYGPVPTEIEKSFLYAVSGISENLWYVEAAAPCATRVKLVSAESGAERFVEVSVTPRLKDTKRRPIKGRAAVKHPDYWRCVIQIPLPLGSALNFAYAQRTDTGFCVWAAVSGSERMEVSEVPFSLSVETCGAPRSTPK